MKRSIEGGGLIIFLFDLLSAFFLLYMVRNLDRISYQQFKRVKALCENGYYLQLFNLPEIDLTLGDLFWCQEIKRSIRLNAMNDRRLELIDDALHKRDLQIEQARVLVRLVSFKLALLGLIGGVANLYFLWDGWPSFHHLFFSIHIVGLASCLFIGCLIFYTFRTLPAHAFRYSISEADCREKELFRGLLLSHDEQIVRQSLRSHFNEYRIRMRHYLGLQPSLDFVVIVGVVLMQNHALLKKFISHIATL